MAIKHSKAPIKKLKTKIAVGTLAAFSLLAVAAPLGSAAADTYSSNTGYHSNNYSNQNYNNEFNQHHRYMRHFNFSRYQHPHHHYIMFRWVYNPREHRWELIGFNMYNHRWEFCDRGQVYHHQWDN